MPDDRMRASRDTYTWILKYIFPGGADPVGRRPSSARSRATHRLTVLDRHAFGLHYAKTLRSVAGGVRGAIRRPSTRSGSTHTFRRMWSLYLAYSEAGFRSGYLDVHQYVFTK